jgi:ribosomal protein S18 acetylase RimI-like enzyme
MNNKIEIIQITEAHIPGFHDCFDSVARERIYLGRLKAHPYEEMEEFTKRNIAQGNIQLVALLDEKVIGWCGIPPIDKEGFRHVGVLGIGIHKDHRGKGIGKLLMQKAIAQAKEKALERIELDVFTVNEAAIGLYKSFGFEIEGMKKKVRKIDGKYYDDLCMALLL